MFKNRIKIVILMFVCCLQSVQNSIQINLPEDGRLNFVELGRKYGKDVKRHEVITKDGYILGLFHIPGKRTRPVLLMHAIIDSGDTFIIRGRKSLAIVLAEAGYDVWVGNARGNLHSRRHTTLDPDSDKKFWDFSTHEVGLYDLPATIDFILNATRQSSLSAIGHSEGNTIFYILGSLRPEYNSKVKVLIALAPVCYFNNVRFPSSIAFQFGPLINAILLVLNEEEVLSRRSILYNFIHVLCSSKENYDICTNLGFFLAEGYDPEGLEREFLPVAMGHYPMPTSRKSVLHLTQIARRRKFSQFDYSEAKNLQIYNSTTPPEYDLSRVTMKVALFAGRNDKLSTLEDVILLRESIPNVIEYHVIKYEKFNHIDFVWGRNNDKYLFPHVFKILKKYL